MLTIHCESSFYIESFKYYYRYLKLFNSDLLFNSLYRFPKLESLKFNEISHFYF